MAAVVAVVVAAIAAVADGCSGLFTSTPIGYIRGLPRFFFPGVVAVGTASVTTIGSFGSFGGRPRFCLDGAVVPVGGGVVVIVQK